MVRQITDRSVNSINSVCSGNHKATVILLRGLAREQEHWGNFPLLLSQAIDQQVHLDPPPSGPHQRLQHPATLTQR